MGPLITRQFSRISADYDMAAELILPKLSFAAWLTAYYAHYLSRLHR